MQSKSIPHHRTVHRLAILTVCLTWPLIWVGGMVTTYDAGMAVPDWPNTYGYNLFLYPYKTWLLGPFDLFIEHGHRLLGALLGFTAIGLVVAAWRTEHRGWVKGFATMILVAVIIQGGLGGIRVVLGDRTFAMIHGTTAPIVFALTVTGMVITSRWWFRYSGNAGYPVSKGNETQSESAPQPERTEPDSENFVALPRLAKGTFGILSLLVVTCYLQLVLGARLRHLQPTGSPTGFLHTTATHVVLAFVLWLMVVVAWARLRKCGDLTLSRPGVALIGLVGIQILLGIGTWVVHYGWPAFLGWFPGAEGYVIESKNYANALLVTSHVATGSLILAVSTFAWVRILRVRNLNMASVTSETAT
ncbi:COX15/CtaA family protein [Novipirellula rosea]|uniref:COX15/CtaA family protein n=1 Tax=Novipirellula rosea TaxID=1031540 RepID=A0ABP8MEE2_9BACT